MGVPFCTAAKYYECDKEGCEALGGDAYAWTVNKYPGGDDESFCAPRHPGAPPPTALPSPGDGAADALPSGMVMDSVTGKFESTAEAEAAQAAAAATSAAPPTPAAPAAPPAATSGVVFHESDNLRICCYERELGDTMLYNSEPGDNAIKDAGLPETCAAKAAKDNRCGDLIVFQNLYGAATCQCVSKGVGPPSTWSRSKKCVCRKSVCGGAEFGGDVCQQQKFTTVYEITYKPPPVPLPPVAHTRHHHPSRGVGATPVAGLGHPNAKTKGKAVAKHGGTPRGLEYGGPPHR